MSRRIVPAMEDLVFPLYVPMTFVLMLGLGFGEYLSPACNVCLVVDMAYECFMEGLHL